jgi:hypothetical protein
MYKNPNRITLAKEEIAMCLPCATKFDEPEDDHFTGVCDGCLRDFVKQLLKNVEAEEDIKKVVIGLENLGGKDRWT